MPQKSPVLSPCLGATKSRFATDLIAWQKDFGRHALPWQNTRDPYRVWLSEIMLQQTQVVTVIDYYARFLQRFPSVTELAEADQDEVLGLWSGLGYYSRARNLHRCAQQVLALHGAEFPATSEQLQTLPGIGPSTAAAIAAFCFSERVAILDGNVKRVLTRLMAFDGDMAEGAAVRQLQLIANDLLPEKNLTQNMPRYTQGLMDLGATLCTRSKPACPSCPVREICLGFATGTPEQYPIKTKKLKRSSQQLRLLWAQKPDGSVWLERRPVSGIWGGLYCLPVFDSEEALSSFVPDAMLAQLEFVKPFVHVLTHKDLHLHPVIALYPLQQNSPAREPDLRVAEAQNLGAWFAPQAWGKLGLPAPIRKLLQAAAL